MAIRNLNLVQENNINQNYILESLANLGQRFGIKGDSIVTSTNLVGDIIKEIFSLNSNNEYSSYVCSIERDNSNIENLYKFSLYNTANNSFNIVGTPIRITSTYKVCEEGDLVDPINSHEYKKVKSINNDDTFSFIVYDKTQKEVILETYKKHSESNLFSLASKELVYSLRFYNNVATFISIDNIGLDDEINYSIINYRGTISYDTLSNKDLFPILTKLSKGDSDIEVELRTLGFTSSSNAGELTFHINTNSYVGTNDEKINYSSKNVYSLVFKEYFNSCFNSLNSGIYFELLIQLYNKIGEEKIYIPLDYEIKVAINDNEAWKVYYSIKDIELRYINTSTSDAIWFRQNYGGERAQEYHNSILCFTSGDERIIFYQFAIDYDSYLDGINTIIVSQSNTFPYIDDEGYWVINGVQTIKAHGENAGNPNIILINSFKDRTGESQFEIIKAEHKDELINRVSWSWKEFLCYPIEKVDLNNTNFISEFDYLSVEAAIPNLPEDKDLAKMLRNSIIINISDINCVKYDNKNYTEEQVKNIYGEDAVITSIWVIDDDSNEFEYVKQRNNPLAAADFNYFSNINNLIQYSLASFTPREADTYLFSHLVFDAISYDLKNNTSDSHSYIYPNLINKLGSQYNTNNLGNYANDMNFIFKFNDNADIDINGKVLGVSQNSGKRYINTNPISSGVSNIVTNALYSYFDTDGRSSKYNEYIPNYNVPSLDLSEVLTRNETLLNRLNILSLDNIGTSYLSYIGTSIDTSKNILTIGTSTLNVNLGTETLAFDSDKKNFVTQNILNIDFPTINLNGTINIKNDLNVDNNINVSGISWNKKDSSYSTVFVPNGRYIYEPGNRYNNSGSIGIVRLNADGSETQMEQLINSRFFNYCIDNNKIYTISTIREDYYVQIEGVSRPSRMHNVYISDGIYIPKLLIDLGFGKYVSRDSSSNKVSLNNVLITSNMDIITFNAIPILLLSHATNLYDYKLYNYDKQLAEGSNSTDAFVEHINNYTGNVFSVNPLKVTYSINSASKLILEIDELTTEEKINYVRKIKCDYTKY